MTHPTDADVEAMALLPCPFCGTEDGVPRKLGFGYHESRDGMWVFCNMCFAEGPLVEPSDRGAAIAAWNRRAIPPHYIRAVEEREGLIEALEAYEREREDMEDRAPTYPECIECNLGTGPHKRTCAHHLARAILSRAKAPTPVAGEGETK